VRAKLTAFFAGLIVFCICDFIWIGIVAREFYASGLGALLRSEPIWLPALLFYPLYVGGLLLFCVTPALAAGSWRKALRLGALLGLVAYATYDLSNLSTLEGWPVTVTVVDIVWGVLVSAVAALAGYAAATVVSKR
jgi:uncharacterized membrane protein